LPPDDESRALGDQPRQLSSTELTTAEMDSIRRLMIVAFGSEDEFTDTDWQHALGGRHFVIERGGEIVAHAAVVERELQVGDRALRTGYVEAVATAPDLQGQGIGSQLMEAVNAFIRETYELGALGTGRLAFYGRLGWLRWLGPSFVRTADGLVRTEDDDGWILVLPTPTSPALDLRAPISCDWRPGDVW
jgi:aminoglycoside 2'-N-acetyltransferase I